MKLNNICELAAAAEYEKEGWKVADSGWPDFLLWRWSGGRVEVKFAEVKSETARVRDNQKTVLNLLSTLAPTVVCQEKSHRFGEVRVVPPLQDKYYHRTDSTQWTPCLQHEACDVQYHICEPAQENANGR